MKTKNSAFSVLFIFLLIFAFVLPVSADIGPKASVHILFENVGGKTYYVALFSEKDSTGPNTAWDGEEAHKNPYHIDETIWEAFQAYTDPDGFFYLQNGEVLKGNEYVWGYYPPNSFKVVLYDVEAQTYLSSGILKRDAFDSYYTAVIGEESFSSVGYDEERSTDSRIKAYRTEQNLTRFVSPLIRIALTVLIELLIAICFGLAGKKRVLLIVGANILTQMLLNFAMISFWENDELLVTILAEIAVFVIEWLLYRRFFYSGEEKEKKKRRIFLYALSANVVTFLAGLLLPAGFPFSF